jgi:hypothetical protein
VPCSTVIFGVCSYSEIVKIRCEDTTSKTESPSVCVTVNCKVCRIAIALQIRVVTSCV